MAGDHTAQFSQEINLENCLEVVFVWSAYTGGVVRDYNFNVTKLSAQFILSHPGVSSVHPVREPDGKDTTKLLYVNTDRATGHSRNDSGDAHDFVLREVWAVG